MAALPGVRRRAKGHGSDKCWLCHLLSGGDVGLRDEKWTGSERLVYGQPGVGLGSSCSEMDSLSGLIQQLQGHPYCGPLFPARAPPPESQMSTSNSCPPDLFPGGSRSSPRCQFNIWGSPGNKARVQTQVLSTDLSAHKQAEPPCTPDEHIDGRLLTSWMQTAEPHSAEFRGQGSTPRPSATPSR